MLIDTTDASFRARYRKQSLERLQEQKRFFNSVGIDSIDIYTDTPYIDSLVQFFSMRASRLRRGFK